MNMVTARYSDIRLVGQFLCDRDDIKRHEKVVLRTDRGTEIGIVLSEPVPYVSPAGYAPPEQPAQSAPPADFADTEPADASGEGQDESGQADAGPTSGKVLRKATPEDLRTMRDIRLTTSPAEAKYCRNKIRELGLPMKLVHVEHMLGGEKIIFYFLADGRVDFRELVKDLAREYRTRIEMKQIGVRDEARLLGDREHCGMELCCRAFLKNFEPITMKMAKNQKATLDPSKISGHCGRLMCCLRYENETYAEYKRKLPKKGSRVITTKGTGEVINYDILSQTVTIETDERRRLVVPVGDVTGRDTSDRKQQKSQRQSHKKTTSLKGKRNSANRR
ncbi:MAG: signal peptidase [Planctomycetota bacterium]|nr:MAG: signal peptidase [Planctomycetota bacterium]